MIHYHGLPITPATAALEAINVGHAFVSYIHPQQAGLAMEVCQSFAIDNGAFTAWKSGSPISDWRPFYAWVEGMIRHPGFDWACIPDVIDGSEDDNDWLLIEWPFSQHHGVPVWHLHESFERLERLVAQWPRIAIGSSGDYKVVGTPHWWARMDAAMGIICNADGEPRTRLHGLRMLNPRVFGRYPFASADSTNIAQNIYSDLRWKGSYPPTGKEARARVLRGRIEAFNSAQRFVPNA